MSTHFTLSLFTSNFTIVPVPPPYVHGGGDKIVPPQKIFWCACSLGMDGWMDGCLIIDFLQDVVSQQAWFTIHGNLREKCMLGNPMSNPEKGYFSLLGSQRGQTPPTWLQTRGSHLLPCHQRNPPHLSLNPKCPSMSIKLPGVMNPTINN